MFGKCAGDLLGGCPDVDEERAVVGDTRRGGFADRALLVDRYEAAGFVSKVLDAGGDNRAAMNARENAAVAEIVQIFPDGLGGNLEPAREIIDKDSPGRPRDIENFSLSEI